MCILKVLMPKNDKIKIYKKKNHLIFSFIFEDELALEREVGP